MKNVLGFDLGGTKSSIGRFTVKDWKLDTYDRMPTNASRGFEAVLEDLIGLIEKTRTPETIAVGIGVPGLIRQPEGFLLNTPNIPGGRDIELKKILEKRITLPVFLENDARCFALAEATLGAGKGKEVVMGMTIGTGVGGGIVIHNKIFHGGHGFAGEIGHMLLKPGEPPYKTKDMRGDAEQFFSGTAMGKRCAEATKPEDYLSGGVCSFMQPDLFREIAWLVTSLTYLLDPSIIVFGGSTGKALKPHLSAIEKELQQWLLPGTPMPELAVAVLEHPGTLGAALLTQKSQ